MFRRVSVPSISISQAWRFLISILALCLEKSESINIICVGEFHRESRQKPDVTLRSRNETVTIRGEHGLSSPDLEASYVYAKQQIEKLQNESPQILLMERGFSNFFDKQGNQISTAIPFETSVFNAPTKKPAKTAFLKNLDAKIGTLETSRTYATIDGYSYISVTTTGLFGGLATGSKIEKPGYYMALYLAHSATLDLRNQEYCKAIRLDRHSTGVAVVGLAHAKNSPLSSFLGVTSMDCCTHVVAAPQLPPFRWIEDIFLLYTYQFIKSVPIQSAPQKWSKLFSKYKAQIKDELLRDVRQEFLSVAANELPGILESIHDTGHRFIQTLVRNIPAEEFQNATQFIDSVHRYASKQSPQTSHTNEEL